MRDFCILFFMLTVVSSCTLDEDDPVAMNAPTPSVTADTTVSLLALGDSYTIGTSVGEQDSWPAQLALATGNRERIYISPFDIVARNGWRTDNLLNALASEPPTRTYNLVSVLIGVNDQYQGFNVSGYTSRLENLLQLAIGYAGGDTSSVFVVSIPDYAFTPFGNGDEKTSRRIDEFNLAARSVADRYGISFYDITPISRQGLHDPGLVADDSLHPSRKQYRRWVDEVLFKNLVAQVRRGG